MHFSAVGFAFFLVWVIWRATAHGLINWLEIGRGVALVAGLAVLWACARPIVDYFRPPACDYACEVQRADAGRTTFADK